MFSASNPLALPCVFRPAYLLGLLCSAWSASAEVVPNPLFSDSAVLQHGMVLPVWGTADDGEKVTVSIQGKSASTTAKDGKWRVDLPALTPGGPFSMTIAGKNTVEVKDLLVGEVWLCAGQSNMERQLGLRDRQQPLVNWEQEVARANYPNIRHFHVKRAHKDQPDANMQGSWTICSPATVAEFTAVGYYFGRDIHKALNLPVGLILNAVGGTPAESWTSRKTLESDPMLAAILERDRKNYANHVAKTQARHAEEVEKAAKEGKPAPKPLGKIDLPRPHVRPSVLYNGMVYPLQPYAMRGVIWYQGESDNGQATQYQTLFPTMLQSWRDAWGQGDFPFLFVQIAPHRDMRPEIRDAQRIAWQKSRNTAMVVTTDCGDKDDIHPTRKEPVGQRLALAARAIAYGEKLVYSGPLIQSAKRDSSQALLAFDHIGTGLASSGGDLRGFELAGADGQFHPAKAQIDGNQLRLHAEAVSEPKQARYAWANVPDVNFINKEGLPASPFQITLTE